MTDPEESTPEGLRVELAELEAELRADASRRLARWFVRQAIGLALVASLARLHDPRWWWALVPMGVLATLSLAVILWARRAVSQEAAAVAGVLDRLDDAQDDDSSR